MPELPEVDKARRLVEDLCLNARVVRVDRPVVDDKVFVDIQPGAFEEALTGKRVVASNRHGKQLWWTLEGDAKPSSTSMTPCFHFGMTGAFVVRGVDGIQYYNSKASGLGDWPPRFAKLVVEFDNGIEIAYVDPRRFGKIRLVENVDEVIGNLGPDPKSSLPDEEAFGGLFARRSAAIKTVLMDQKIIAGIGNWMADEILYRARVHPETRANELNEEQLAAIRSRVEEVVRVACDANSDHDLFPSDWLFHHRWGKQDGAKVNGDAIKFIEIGGRTTAYVPKLQLKTGGGSMLNKSSRSVAAKIKKEIKTEPDVMNGGNEDDSTVRARSSRRGSSTSTSATAKRARTTATDASAVSGVRARVARAVTSAANRAVRLLR